VKYISALELPHKVVYKLVLRPALHVGFIKALSVEALFQPKLVQVPLKATKLPNVKFAGLFTVTPVGGTRV
jgi:hypothetical protein